MTIGPPPVKALSGSLEPRTICWFSADPPNQWTNVESLLFSSCTEYDFDGVKIIPLDGNTEKCSESYSCRVYETLSPPFEQTLPTAAVPKSLFLPSIAGFESLGCCYSGIGEEMIVGTAAAAERLVTLKGLINSFQGKRKQYWKRQAGTGFASAGLAFATLGASAAVGAFAGAYHGAQIDQLVHGMKKAISQINELRSVFGEDNHWEQAEQLLRIKKSVFKFDIEREELSGCL